MCKEPHSRHDIAKGEDIKPRLSSTSGGIHGKQYGPGDETSDEAHKRQHLEESQPQVVVDRRMLQNEFIIKPAERCAPAKEASISFGCVLVFRECVDVGARDIYAVVELLRNQEDYEHDC